MGLPSRKGLGCGLSAVPGQVQGWGYLLAFFETGCSLSKWELPPGVLNIDSNANV